MSFSPCLRPRISSPLEAGPSVADGHHLPSHVAEALEYASKRLGRKAAHITLLVVRKDYQLPTSPVTSPTCGATPPPASAASTPSRPAPAPTSRLEAFKQLVRPGQSGDGQIRERIVHVHLDQLRNGTVSPAFSEASTASSVSTADSTFSHRMRWPGSSAAYGSVPVTPATPFTVVSSLSGTDANSAVSPPGLQDPTHFGMRLVYAHPLSPREEKHLSQALDKAARKFKLDPSWLPQAVSPSTLGLPVDLVVKSTAQNEPLFSSEHLTLLSLDRLYTFRAALQAYTRTTAPCRLEDAVDELRRLFLANGRRALRKSALVAAYRWLDPVNDAALADVCRMYERAYGGVERESGVENDVDPVPSWPLAEESRDLDGAEQSSLKRMGILAPGIQGLADCALPQQDSESRAVWSMSELTDALDKEILFSGADFISLDDQDELDEIEAWYRETQDEASHTEMQTLCSYPRATSSAAVIETRPPSPSRTPPPAPTSPSPPSDAWPKPDDAELNEMRRTTPKLRPAPPGRSLALKLQTTFDKPAATTTTSEQPHSPAGDRRSGGGHVSEEEEELTARPHSAVKFFANARWTTSIGNGVSIDEMLHGGGPQQAEVDALSQPGIAEERLGPTTPNGYDDISPITRGEWGFLMSGKGKTARVEMC